MIPDPNTFVEKSCRKPDFRLRPAVSVILRTQSLNGGSRHYECQIGTRGVQAPYLLPGSGARPRGAEGHAAGDTDRVRCWKLSCGPGPHAGGDTAVIKLRPAEEALYVPAM